ncbi:sterile alpha motif domain-containing protein 1-like [Rhipicephalus microplus]|uniref:sterile alpha motif domain-containing protein 1-like n=1 Tax=Rhipicephalus microplus TaxID=6941 RepID=UPI003F6B7A5A
MLFEGPTKCGILLQETCTNSFDAEGPPKKSASLATLVGAHCYCSNIIGAPKRKEIVLDTIDQLQKSKARPGFERICHMLYQRHDLSKADVQEEINLLVDSEVVIQRDYNGNTSFRIAAK